MYRRPQPLYFYYDLERGIENLEVEVMYTIDDDDISIESVRYNGAELETTEAEDRELLQHALERMDDDMADAKASYGDFLCDMERDERD